MLSQDFVKEQKSILFASVEQGISQTEPDRAKVQTAVSLFKTFMKTPEAMKENMKCSHFADFTGSIFDRQFARNAHEETAKLKVDWAARWKEYVAFVQSNQLWDAFTLVCERVLARRRRQLDGLGSSFRPDDFISEMVVFWQCISVPELDRYALFAQYFIPSEDDWICAGRDNYARGAPFERCIRYAFLLAGGGDDETEQTTQDETGEYGLGVYGRYICVVTGLFRALTVLEPEHVLQVNRAFSRVLAHLAFARTIIVEARAGSRRIHGMDDRVVHSGIAQHIIDDVNACLRVCYRGAERLTVDALDATRIDASLDGTVAAPQMLVHWENDASSVIATLHAISLGARFGREWVLVAHHAVEDLLRSFHASYELLHELFDRLQQRLLAQSDATTGEFQTAAGLLRIVKRYLSHSDAVISLSVKVSRNVYAELEKGHTHSPGMLYEIFI